MINLKSALGITVASVAAVQAAAQKTESFKPVTPNIVLILMDDMGYGDIGRTGANQYTTPNLDRLANQGMQFTRYYCPQAVSSASRAGLREGKGTSWEGGQRVPCIMRWPGLTGTETMKEPELYDLRRDPGEWYNVAQYYPEKVKELQLLTEEARKDIGDDLTNSPEENRRKAGSVK